MTKERQQNKIEKPNCYDCKHRGDIPGDAHSCCRHPTVRRSKKRAVAELIALIGGMSLLPPAAARLGIKGHPTGIRGGWFAWPWNYDPVWLLACNGFTAKTQQAKKPSTRRRRIGGE